MRPCFKTTTIKRSIVSVGVLSSLLGCVSTSDLAELYDKPMFNCFESVSYYFSVSRPFYIPNISFSKSESNLVKTVFKDIPEARVNGLAWSVGARCDEDPNPLRIQGEHMDAEGGCRRGYYCGGIERDWLLMTIEGTRDRRQIRVVVQLSYFTPGTMVGSLQMEDESVKLKPVAFHYKQIVSCGTDTCCRNTQLISLCPLNW